MPDDTKIEPALSAEEWAKALGPDDGITWTSLASALGIPLYVGIVRTIALANAALPDDDPRKITWEMVDAFRGLAEDYEHRGDPAYTYGFAIPSRMADALASYLPPRGR